MGRWHEGAGGWATAVGSGGLAVEKRLDGRLAVVSVARKRARRCHHTLSELGDDAWLPIS